MPIWLRKFTFKTLFTFSTLQAHYKEEQDAIEESKNQNQNKQTAIGPDGKINPQSFKKPTKSNYR